MKAILIMLGVLGAASLLYLLLNALFPAKKKKSEEPVEEEIEIPELMPQGTPAGPARLGISSFSMFLGCLLLLIITVLIFNYVDTAQKYILLISEEIRAEVKIALTIIGVLIFIVPITFAVMLFNQASILRRLNEIQRKLERENS